MPDVIRPVLDALAEAKDIRDSSVLNGSFGQKDPWFFGLLVPEKPITKGNIASALDTTELNKEIKEVYDKAMTKGGNGVYSQPISIQCGQVSLAYALRNCLYARYQPASTIYAGQLDQGRRASLTTGKAYQVMTSLNKRLNGVGS